MKKLNNNETKMIVGGAISGFGWFLIGNLVIFISGIIDGISRPFKCN